MISLPKELSPLFASLSKARIRPIVVGGFVRDALLKKSSNDIDIELYGVKSLEEIEKILERFGKLNLVGKSFGVLKLRLGQYSLDFSPPRSESKHGFGHQGFEIHWYSNLDFYHASLRRDFTINAIGYDPISQDLLDPHGGIKDLDSKRLRHTDPNTFGDDPLRVLRAVQFAARYNLRCDDELLVLCREMIAHGALKELPKERIFEEIKKLLLLSQKPSTGLDLLENMGGSSLFEPLNPETWRRAVSRCDEIALLKCSDNTLKLAKMFAALALEHNDPQQLLETLIFHKALIRQALAIIHYAQEFGELEPPPPPLLQGRDLIALGLTPSNDFKSLLNRAYKAQLHEKITSHNDIIKWFKHHCL